ncbi:MAG TPA: signal peptidase II [Longimicrobiaceae bacterium]|nr:signal peptidase II [Longimicrobiaceae bacterium]
MTESRHPIRRTFRRLLGQRRAVRRPEDAPGRRASDAQPMRGWGPAAAIAAGVALLDWAVKIAVSSSMEIGEFRQVIEGRVALWHVRNPAMVLGLWENFPLEVRKLIAVAAALVGTLVLLQVMGRGQRFPRHQRGWAWLFVGLVLGGMLGNLGERALHWGVTDYLSIRWGNYWMPPGNVADVALFLSFPLALPVIVFELLGRAQRRPRRGSLLPADGPAAGALPGG